ncbi:MAG: alpha-1,2-fucosyltransferase [Planctomycetota bacterium]
MAQPLVLELRFRLGNQLFQYAAGRAAAHRTGADLVIDPRVIEAQEGVKYELHHFNVQARMAEPHELPADRKPPVPHRFHKLYHAVRRTRMIETRDDFNPRGLRPRPATWLRGFWLHEAYFADAADLIREELRVIDPPSDQDRAVEAAIGSAACPVSVHVRRGDYTGLVDKVTQLGPDYYARAAQRLLQEIDQPPTFFVFSDDPQWAEQALELPGPTVIVSHNTGETAHHDLRLMSLCHHHLIANSTFSWWGAWLNPSPDKRVLTPSIWCDPQWWRTEQLNLKDWIQVPVESVG